MTYQEFKNRCDYNKKNGCPVQGRIESVNSKSNQCVVSMHQKVASINAGTGVQTFRE